MKLWLLWLLVPFILIGIAWLRVGVCVSYYKERVSFQFIVGKLQFQISRGDEPKEQTTKKSSKQKSKKKSHVKAWAKTILEHLDAILEVIGRILTSPTLEKLELSVIVGGEDPEKCVMTYGRICAFVSGILPVIENIYDVKKRRVDVRCSFETAHTELSVEAAATLKIYEIVALAAAVLKLLFQLRSQVKSYYESGASL